jgi:hypothetical protein
VTNDKKTESKTVVIFLHSMRWFSRVIFSLWIDERFPVAMPSDITSVVGSHREISIPVDVVFAIFCAIVDKIILAVPLTRSFFYFLFWFRPFQLLLAFFLLLLVDYLIHFDAWVLFIGGVSGVPRLGGAPCVKRVRRRLALIGSTSLG